MNQYLVPIAAVLMTTYAIAQAHRQATQQPAYASATNKPPK